MRDNPLATSYIYSNRNKIIFKVLSSTRIVPRGCGRKTRPLSNDPCPYPRSDCHFDKCFLPSQSVSATSVSTCSSHTVTKISNSAELAASPTAHYRTVVVYK